MSANYPICSSLLHHLARTSIDGYQESSIIIWDIDTTIDEFPWCNGTAIPLAGIEINDFGLPFFFNSPRKYFNNSGIKIKVFTTRTHNKLLMCAWGQSMHTKNLIG